jgi:hypothetical protein
MKITVQTKNKSQFRQLQGEAAGFLRGPNYHIAALYIGVGFPKKNIIFLKKMPANTNIMTIFAAL